MTIARLTPLGLLFLALPAAAKPLHKHPDFKNVNLRDALSHQVKVCNFEELRDTKVAGTVVHEGEVVGTACEYGGAVILSQVYRPGMRVGAGGVVYYGTRLDTGKLDFITEHPTKRAAVATETDYDRAWSPLINGTSDAQQSAFFAGRDQGDGTYEADVIGVEGKPLVTLSNVTDVVDYKTAYLVSSSQSFGKTHQVVSIDGTPLTPLLPELTQSGKNWVFAVDDGLVLPVHPDGVIGRTNPKIKGYKSLGPGRDRTWAYGSVWEMPDGSIRYGLADKDFGTMTGPRFIEFGLLEHDHGWPHLMGQHEDGSWRAYELHASYKPTAIAIGGSLEELRADVERFHQVQIARNEASQAAFDAEMEARRQQKAAAQAAYDKAQAEQRANNPPVVWRQGLSCDGAHAQRDQLTLDEAHDAMVNCYNTLPYIEWLAIDRIYMALQRGPSIELAPVTPYYAPRVGQDQDAITRQRFNDDLDRYMRGASGYDPTDTDW
jgi:hypothetical protein